MRGFWDSRVPTILAIIILVSGIAAGVYLVKKSKVFKLGASPETTPQDVRITNVSFDTFSVSWVTDKKTAGVIDWGQNQSLGKQEVSGEPKNVHFLTIRGLTAETTYFFKIRSDGVEYDNSGISWEVRTGLDIPEPASGRVLSGSVLTSDNKLAENVVVHVTGGGIAPLSGVTTSNGTWLIPISQARSSDLSSYATLDPSTPLDIFVQGGPQGIATAKILVGGADPTPPIILGSNHDFRGETQVVYEELPEANVNLPLGTTKRSGFNIPKAIPPASAEVVTLESLDEGEVIASTKPEFFGEGPSGVTITIKVESDPVSATIKVSSSGWKWSPPQNLSEGAHKITINWRDERGILRQLTRTFIVQAAEAPAFESTPSATITPSPTRTPTPSPTKTPPPGATLTPTPSPTKTPSPTSTPTSTGTITPTVPPELPPAGTTLPTFLGIAVGILLLMGSILLAI
ncbi:fibronectin type III domain-containing protein [Candidatus Woesebacteria bacterium]|nr:fibronectin type III domain-containing protein [Candidatus Woesebacteria bacterium]